MNDLDSKSFKDNATYYYIMPSGFKDKEREKEYMKQYYELNKDLLNQKRQVKITCECGKTFAKDHKWKHQKSSKHIKYENEKANESNNE